MEEEMDVQELVYYSEGNNFTGSRTKNPLTGSFLRYRIAPDRENARLKLWTWREDVCFELAREKTEDDFPFTEEGLERLKADLIDKYSSL